ncbi:MAG: hypothetical protein AOA66_1577 [Candidatus Bathyarchaeota archaeon BA2]|nr:MAG: hypothetical protein AOA66_1577 [Candidatus Bathyarchaeota archaeon BA2]
MNKDLIVAPTIGGSYVYAANTVAAFLKKKVYPYLPAPPPYFVKFKKYTPKEALSLNLNEQSRKITALYEDFAKGQRFDAIIFGAPNGGIVNLAVAIGVPYLCSQFRVPVLIGSGGKDDLEPYVKVVKLLGKRWTVRHPWSSVCCLVDPIHDRMDMGVYAHVRSKFIDIPPAYKEFIERHLNPRGTLIFVNVTYPWAKYRLGERTYLQVGGLGDIPPEEYLKGSERLEEFLELVMSNHQGGWNLPDYELATRPESEWGAEPELKEAVLKYCKQRGYDLLYLEHSHPAGFNILASHAMHMKHTADGGSCGGYFINIFWALCPTLALRARLLSSWFTFTDRASLKIAEQQLRRLLKDFPEVPKKAILGYNWSHPGAQILDIVPPSGWLEMLSKCIPPEEILTPGIADLGRTDHDIFKYEDMLYEESEKHAGKESAYNVTVEDLKSLPALRSAR